MNQIEEDIQTVEVTLEEAKKHVEFGKALERLAQNKDFIEVISEGYFLHEASRLTLLQADRSISDATRARVLRSLEAVGELHSYFHAAKMRARQMEIEIERNSELLDELRGELDGDQGEEA